MINPFTTATGTLGSGAAVGGLLKGGMASIGPLGWAGLAAANVLGSVLGSSAEARQRRKEADIRAAEIEAQPWTKQAAQTQISTKEPNMWANLLGSGFNVLSQGQAIQRSMQDAQTAEQNNLWRQMMIDKASQMNPVLMGNRSYLNPWENPTYSSGNQ